MKVCEGVFDMDIDILMEEYRNNKSIYRDLFNQAIKQYQQQADNIITEESYIQAYKSLEREQSCCTYQN